MLDKYQAMGGYFAFASTASQASAMVTLQMRDDNFRMNTGMVDMAPLIIWFL
jgi:hypothetical protein